jgi:chromosome segregation ATPase
VQEGAVSDERDRCQGVAQTLIASIGASGPEDVESVAVRAVAEIEKLRAMCESAEQSSDNWHKEAERLRAELAEMKRERHDGYIDVLRGELAAAHERVRELEERHARDQSAISERDGARKTVAIQSVAIAEREARIAELERDQKLIMLDYASECTRAETAERELGEMKAPSPAIEVLALEFCKVVGDGAHYIEPKLAAQWMRKAVGKAESDLAEARVVIERVRERVDMNIRRTDPRGIDLDPGDVVEEFAALRALLAPPTASVAWDIRTDPPTLVATEEE